MSIKQIAPIFLLLILAIVLAACQSDKADKAIDIPTEKPTAEMEQSPVV